MSFSKKVTTQVSRRAFGFGFAAFGLVACGNVTSANQRVNSASRPVVKPGLPADLQPMPNAG